MLTPEDIKNVAEQLKKALSEVFATKEDFAKLDGMISKLQASVDAIVLNK